jgi:tetratricopeptide (TPR) repeat protein
MNHRFETNGTWLTIFRNRVVPSLDMRTFSISSPATADRSFTIALSVVALFAAAEICAAVYHYVTPLRLRRATLQPNVAVTRTPAPAPAATAAAQAAPSAAPLSPSDQAVNEAVALRDRGDTANALAKLQTASEQDPSNPKILEELARTYEALQNVELANDTWRKIQELGPAAGASFALADQRLKAGLTTPSATGAGLPGPARLDAASSDSAAPPSSDTSALTISDVQVTETPDADAETNLAVRVGIQKRTPAVIDHTKVKIQVFFYDTVEDKDIKLTDADVTYEWLTPNHDWAGVKPEVLAVNYVRPKNKVLPSEAALSAAAASVNPGKKTRPNKPTGPEGQRKYLGYIVRVYYQDQLQAVRADPNSLLKKFPPPSTASP